MTEVLTMDAALAVATTSAPDAPAPMKMPELNTAETDRDRFARNRAKIVENLRAKASKQITRQFFDGHGGMCFVGCAVDALGDV